jgi:hypothetical protein
VQGASKFAREKCNLKAEQGVHKSPYFQTFMEPRNRFQGINSASLCTYVAWWAGTITLFLVGS